MSTYHAYLLRIWRDEDEAPGPPGPWRFSLEEPASGDRRGFRSLAEVTAFLHLSLAPVDRPADPIPPKSNPTSGEMP